MGKPRPSYASCCWGTGRTTPPATGVTRSNKCSTSYHCDTVLPQMQLGMILSARQPSYSHLTIGGDGWCWSKVHWPMCVAAGAGAGKATVAYTASGWKPRTVQAQDGSHVQKAQGHHTNPYTFLPRHFHLFGVVQDADELLLQHSTFLPSAPCMRQLTMCICIPTLRGRITQYG